MYGEAMKEALQNKGASLTKDELIISSVCSKAGDRDFYVQYLNNVYMVPMVWNQQSFFVGYVIIMIDVA
jgi:hypothetical protein